MTDLEEALAAVRGCRRTGLPVAALLTFFPGKEGIGTADGGSPERAAAALLEAGAFALGANCASTLEITREAVERLKRAAPETPIVAMPSAGIPREEGGALVYPETPE